MADTNMTRSEPAFAGSASQWHPDYEDRAPEWRVCRDAFRGETRIKERDSWAGDVTAGSMDTPYLPVPDGFRVFDTATLRARAYNQYKLRARFPEILAPTIMGMVGIIHRSESNILLPPSMEPLWERATRDKLPLEALHRRITTELLITGRYGLLAGAKSNPEPGDLPFLTGYTAEEILNWDEDNLDLFVLNESGYYRDGFSWKEEFRYRVLRLDESGRYVAEVHDQVGGVDRSVMPTGRGNQPLTAIPFTIIGARDLSLTPETPPLIGVARSSIAQYQLNADYRWQLFMSGQETAVIVNNDPPEAVGAGVILTLMSDGDMPADFKYVGPSCRGIQAHKEAIQEEQKTAMQAAGAMFDTRQPANESGDARRLRYAAQTATLVTVSMSSAQGLERALRSIAVMMGEDPEQVVVAPDLNFVNTALTPQEVKEVIEGWQMGGYSYETMYERLRRGDAVSAERGPDDELRLMDNERIPVSPQEAGILTDPTSMIPAESSAPNEVPDGDST